jgi:hypothetical protein
LWTRAVTKEHRVNMIIATSSRLGHCTGARKQIAASLPDQPMPWNSAPASRNHR